MRRTFATVTVVLVLVVAGCSGIGGDAGGGTESPTTAMTDEPKEDTTTETSTDGGNGGGSTAASERSESTDTAGSDGGETSAAPTTATPTSTRRATSSGLTAENAPPGVTGEGVRNLSALSATHSEILNGSQYRQIHEETNASGRTVRYVVANGSDGFVLDIGVSSVASLQFWASASGDTVAVTNETGAETSYEYSWGETSTAFGFAIFSSFIEPDMPPNVYLRFVEATVDGVVTRDGQQVVRLAIDGFNQTRLQQVQQGFVSITSEGESLTGVQGEAFVRPNGLVTEMSIKQTVETADGATSEYDISYRVENVGSATVRRPPWLDRAPQFQASLAENDRLLVLDHTGGATVEAGTTLTVSIGPGTTRNVSLSEPITEGDTVYLYATEDGSVKAELNSRPSVPDSARTLGTSRLQVTGTIGDVTFTVAPPADD